MGKGAPASRVGVMRFHLLVGLDSPFQGRVALQLGTGAGRTLTKNEVNEHGS